MTLDLAAVLRGTNARLYEIQPGGDLQPGVLSAADLERSVGKVTVDSRQVELGDLFVALPGEQTHGERFVGQALEAGALACLVEHLPDDVQMPSGRPHRYILQSDSSLTALQNLGRRWKRERGVEVVGITGSIGKTTTKEIVASVLSISRRVLKSEANINTEIGLPLSLLRLGYEHEVAVLEMGMYGPGEIALLASIAEPRIGVVTNVAPIHLERLGSIEGIARAKSELVAALPAEGLAVLNGDDEWTRAMAVTSGIARSVLVGFGSQCTIRADDIQEHGLDGLSWTLIAEGKRFPLRTAIPGRHTVRAFLAAVAVARELGLSWQDVTTAIESAVLGERQRILRPEEGLLIIDDSYNAAPMSMNAALDLLAAAPGYKIAVLGDMLELGPGEEQAHRDVGARAAHVADWLVTRGTRACWMAEAAVLEGMERNRVMRVPGNDEAVRTVRRILAEGTGEWSVLVKGSRGMRMEEVVHELRGQA